MVIKIKKENGFFLVGVQCSKCEAWETEKIPVPKVIAPFVTPLMKKIGIEEIENDIPGTYFCSECEPKGKQKNRGTQTQV